MVVYRIGETTYEIKDEGKTGETILIRSSKDSINIIELKNNNIIELLTKDKNDKVKIGTIVLYPHEMEEIQNIIMRLRNAIEKNDDIDITITFQDTITYLGRLIKEREEELERKFEAILNELFKLADISEKLEALKHEKENILDYMRYCFNLLFS